MYTELIKNINWSHRYNDPELYLSLEKCGAWYFSLPFENDNDLAVSHLSTSEAGYQEQACKKWKKGIPFFCLFWISDLNSIDTMILAWKPEEISAITAFIFSLFPLNK